jgi:hypothetical protein
MRKISPHCDSMPETSSSQPLAIMTALSRPEYILVTLIYVVIFREIWVQWFIFGFRANWSFCVKHSRMP